MARILHVEWTGRGWFDTDKSVYLSEEEETGSSEPMKKMSDTKEVSGLMTRVVCGHTEKGARSTVLNILSGFNMDWKVCH